MFEIFSLVLGGALRFIPELMKLWDKGRERDHEARMLDLQVKADEARSKLELQKIETQGKVAMDVAEVQALIAATQAQAVTYTKTGNKWWDGLYVLAETASTFVRPVLTYWYCVVMYGSYKTASYILLRNADVAWANAVVVLWTNNDVAVMMSIIGFWFVDRSIRHQRN